MLSEKGQSAKQELEEFQYLKRRIVSLKNELAEVVETYSVPKKVTVKMPMGKGGSNSSTQERYVLKVESLVERLERLIDEAVDKEQRFLDAMQDLDEFSYKILIERYLIGKPLKKIIQESYYSERWFYEKYNRAIEKFGESVETKKDSSKVQ